MMASSEVSELAPPAGEFLANMSAVYVGITAACAALTLLTLGIYINQIVFIFRRLDKWPLRFHVLFLLSVYPVYSLLSMVTFFVPRSVPVNDMVSGLYISIALYVFVRMLIGNYGGTSKMMEKLIGEPLNLRSPPVCCCFFCLEPITLTRTVIFMLEGAVLQYGILRPITAYSQAVILAEKLGDFDFETVFSRGTILTTSTLIAMYGLQLLQNVSIQPLRHIPLKAKFRCLQIVLIIDNVQSSLFTTLGSKGLIPGDDGLTSLNNSYRIHRFITVFEMLVLSVVARLYYHRHMTGLVQTAGLDFSRTGSTRSSSGIITQDELEGSNEEAIEEIIVRQPPPCPAQNEDIQEVEQATTGEEETVAITIKNNEDNCQSGEPDGIASSSVMVEIEEGNHNANSLKLTIQKGSQTPGESDI